jgi:hypothetical protein
LTLNVSVTFPRAMYKSDVFNTKFARFDGVPDYRQFANVKMKPYFLIRSQFKQAPGSQAPKMALLTHATAKPGTGGLDRCYSPK